MPATPRPRRGLPVALCSAAALLLAAPSGGDAAQLRPLEPRPGLLAGPDAHALLAAFCRRTPAHTVHEFPDLASLLTPAASR